MLIEIGGGTKPHPRAEIVIDPVHPRGIGPRHAQLPWDGISDNSCDEVYASHVMEHVPKPHVITVMNEAWRVLKPGGTFMVTLPVTGVTDRGTQRVVDNWRAWADPTHVSSWWLPESFMYFTGEIGADADYATKRWLPLKRIPEDLSEMMSARSAHTPSPSLGHSVWALRDGWEGFVQLEKAQ